MNKPFQAVIDASVGVKLFANEPLMAQAHAVFARLATERGASFIVPDLFYSECSNVFWKWVTHQNHPTQSVVSYMRNLVNLPLKPIPTQNLAIDALELALRFKISAYDACYAAASIQFQIPLITADEKLVAKFSQSPHDIRWLGDF